MTVTKIMALLLLFGSQLAAQFYLDGIWKSIGPFGSGYNTNLLLDPRDNGRIYAFGNGTLFRSDNKGQDWQDITPFVSPDSYADNQLYIKENNPDQIYFIYNGEGKIFKSDNGGNTWNMFYSDENNYNIFFMDKNDPNVLLAYKSIGGWGNYFRIILKSEDRGASWYELMNGIDSQDGPVSVFLNTEYPNYMIAMQDITDGGDVVYDLKYFRSVNGGTLWQEMDIGTDTYFYLFLFDPYVSTNMYSIKNKQDKYEVYKSSNFGESWFEIGSGLPEANSFNNRFALSFVPGNSDKMFLTLITDYYLNGVDIYSSENGGVNWNLYGNIPDSRKLSQIIINPANNNEFYMASFPLGILYSMNQGSSWDLVYDGLTQTEINSFSLVNSDIIFAAVGKKGMFKTTNSGASWSPFYENTSSSVGKIFVSKSNDQFVFTNVGIDVGDYSISTDQGETWNSFFCSDCDLYTFDISSDNQTIYGDTYLGSNNGLVVSGIIKSTDMGESWNLLDTGFDDINTIKSIKIDPTNENIVYAIIFTRGEVYHDYLIKTTDGGNTWNILAENAIDLFINYPNPNYIYYATIDKFYISSNAGESFQVINLENMYSDIEFLETNPGVLIGLNYNGSIDISRDYGFTWTEIPELVGTSGINEIEICSEQVGDITLFGSTYTRGILKCTLNNITEINPGNNKLPTEFRLLQNHPNPFNPSTTIEYSIPEKSFVTINIYNTIGETVAELVNEEQDVGNHKIFFNAMDFSSGVYFYKITCRNFSETRKMVLLK